MFHESSLVSTSASTPRTLHLASPHLLTHSFASLLFSSLLIVLDGPLELEPSCTVLHYAQTIFEGMKAYRHDDGRVTLFRPDMNMKRMNTSAARIALPVSGLFLSSCRVAPFSSRQLFGSFYCIAIPVILILFSYRIIPQRNH